MTHSEREALAEYAHDAWSGWMDYVFDKGVADMDGGVRLPRWAVERWKRQMKTKYADLSENEKESDRAEADKMLAIVGAPGASAAEGRTPSSYYRQ